MTQNIHIIGMHGLGDNIHQRAIIRQYMEHHNVTLETSWASLYHDLTATGKLKLARRPVGLRTQAKNATRESHLFSSLRHAVGMRTLRVAYSGAQAMSTPSKTVLEAMCNVTGADYASADYRLPVAEEWRAGLFRKLGALPVRAYERPWLVYRPLVARSEWRGSARRNADPGSYAAIYAELRDKFFVISLADLEPGKEWIVGPETQADLTFHAGELVFEDIAALFRVADLVLTSSGFAAILAPAVETPCISAIGGYEFVGCHDSGKKFAPYIAFGPDIGCTCWTQACGKACGRALNLDVVLPQVREFIKDIPNGGTGKSF